MIERRKRETIIISTRKRTFYNLINLIIFAVIIASVYFINIAISELDNMVTESQQTVQQIWREQARRTLSDLRQQFLLEVQDETLNPYDELAVQKWASIHLNGVRNGGETSDGFMIEMKSEKFIWDGSPDCSKPEFITNGRYMKDEAALHSRPDLAEIALDEMRKIYTTNSNSNVYWVFDNSPELLEFTIIPTDTLGFNGETYTEAGIRNKDYKSYLICLGTQADEIQKPFAPFDTKVAEMKNYLYMSMYTIIIGGIGFMFWYLFKDFKYGREGKKEIRDNKKG